MAAPLLAGAGMLLAPLVGGAMSLAGGALSLTGGLTHAASTAAGMAFDVGKGVAGAAGGMLGGGKSGNKVEQVADKKGKMHDVTSPTGKAVIAGKKYQEQKARIQAGKDLGVKAFTPPTAGGDGEKSESSLLSQILSITTINSGFLANISTGMDSLVAGALSQSATEKRESGLEGAETPGEKKQGAISSGLSKAWGGMKKTFGSVSDGLKMAAKALMLGGVFLLLRKYRTNITEWMGGIFEMFDGWYHTLKDSEDPWATAWEGIKTWGEKTFKILMSWIEEKTEQLFNFIYDAVTNFANNILFGSKGDKAVSKQTGAFFSSGSELEDIKAANITAGGTGDLGFVGKTWKGDFETTDPLFGNKLDAKTRGETTAAMQKRWNSMYNISRASDWAIQWTRVPFMHAGIGNWDLLNPNPNTPLTRHNRLAIDAVLGTQPIVNGEILPVEALRDPKLLSKKVGIREGMSDDDISGILANAASASSARWVNQNQAIRDNPLSGFVAFDEGPATNFMEHFFPGFSGFGDIEQFITDINASSIGRYGAIPMEERAKLELEFYKKANTPGSIFTHDTYLEELLKPVSKAFAEGKQTPPVVLAPDQRNQSVTKLGDSYSGNLSSRVQDNTAMMLAYTKNLHSTTGQFA